ncbi:MAG: O-antigen ligase family protein [Pirellulales bacterium]
MGTERVLAFEQFTPLARLQLFLQTANVGLIAVALAGLLTLLLLGLFGRRLEMFFLLMASFTLSGSVFQSLDSGCTMLRWLLIILLALNCFRLRVNPGPTWVVFGAFLIVGMSMTIFSDTVAWSVQWAGLLLLTFLSAGVMAGYIQDRATATKICLVFILVAIPWVLLGMVGFKSMMAGAAGGGSSGNRLAAFFLNPQGFARNGGIFLPFMLWGAMRPTAIKWRVVCGFAVVAMVILLLASTQRAGTFAGIAGCLPLLFRRRMGGILLTGLIVVAISVTAFRLASVNRERADYIAKRFLNTSTTGRSEAWAVAFKECVKHPFLGQGFGTNKALYEKNTEGLAVHNAYLATWYDTGIFGLLLFVGAMVYGVYQAFLLAVFAQDRQIGELARLALGVLFGIIVLGMVEDSSNSPSNICTITLLIMLVMVSRLTVIADRERAWLSRAALARAASAWRFVRPTGTLPQSG